MTLRRAAIVTIVLLPAGCGSNTTTSPQPIVTPTVAPTAAPTPVPTPAPTPTGVNQPPTGSFRFTPAVVSDHIQLFSDNVLHVNAARFHDPDGDKLYLTVLWGDGTSNHIACGPCRLEHQYVARGELSLVAQVTDLHNRPVATSVLVDTH
jgi:hypothetical protein